MKSKIIGLNLLFLIPNKVGGSEPYSRRLIDAFYKYDNKNKYILFCNNENYNTFDSKYDRVLIPINATNRSLRLLVEQLVLPIYLLIHKVDIVYSLGYISPFLTHCKSIVNIFDLNWYYHPEDFSLMQRMLWKFFVTFSAKFSDAITTSSFASKKSIQTILNPNKRIEVIYSGLPTLTTTKNDLIAAKKEIPYLFSLSAAYPHKNLITLLRAHKELYDRGVKVNLLIAGLGGRSNDELEKYMKENTSGKLVKRLGYITDSRMTALYKKAEALVFTSAYEGFGIPIIEAFSLGLSVISSNAFSLKEVVGKGGSLVHPMDYVTFSKLMEKIILDKKFKKKMSIKSKNESNRFSWQESVVKLTSFFDRVVSY